MILLTLKREDFFPVYNTSTHKEIFLPLFIMHYPFLIFHLDSGYINNVFIAFFWSSYNYRKATVTVSRHLVVMEPQLPSSIPGLRDFVSDSERLQDVFDTAFLPNNDGVTKLENWFETDFEEEVVMKMKESLSTESELRLLGIGTGNGRKLI